MKKLSLIGALLLAILLLQNCKKDTFIATAYTNSKLFAIINDTTWTPDTVNAAVTYTSAAKTKVFSFSGTAFNKQVNISVTQNNGSNTPGFTIGSYNVNSSPNVVMTYLNAQKNAQGNYVLTQQGTVGPGSGFLVISAIDSVKKVVTGTFSFTAKRTNYDVNGNVTSVFVANVFSGAFNNLPYTFVSN